MSPNRSGPVFVVRRNDELMHWGLKKGEEKEDHKYIARVETGKPKNPYRYFYTQKEYDSYLKTTKQKKESNGFFNSLSSLFSKATSSLNIGKIANKSINNVDKKIVETGKTFIQNASKKTDKILRNIDNKIVESGQKVLSNILKKTEKIGNDYTETMTKKYSEVKKEVGYSNSPSQLGKTFVSNVLNGMKNSSMKVWNKISNLKELPKKKDTYSDEEDQAVVNPDYSTENYSTSMNCAYCTAAYELRQRGYDVEASPVTTSTYNNLEEIMSWYKDPDVYQFTSSGCKYNITTGEVEYDETYNETKKDIENQMKSYGEGARGQYIVYWATGGGHSMAWEVTNGEVIIRDCQTNKTVDIDEYMPYVSDGVFFRTDNLELNDKITKAVRQRVR